MMHGLRATCGPWAHLNLNFLPAAVAWCMGCGPCVDLVIRGDSVLFFYFWLFVHPPIRRLVSQPGQLSTKSQKCKHHPILPSIAMCEPRAHLNILFFPAAVAWCMAVGHGWAAGEHELKLLPAAIAWCMSCGPRAGRGPRVTGAP